MFLPVTGEPFDLFIADAGVQFPAVQRGILRIRLQSSRDIYPEPLWVDRQPTVVEQLMDVPTEEQSAVLMMNAELRIAV